MDIAISNIVLHTIETMLDGEHIAYLEKKIIPLWLDNCRGEN